MIARHHPHISIVVCSFNHGLYIGQALESILSQGFTDFEVIVIDDGSVDESWNIISGFVACDGRIRAFKHPDGGNHGLCATLKLGLRQCTGEYVAFLESDDIWKPDCLEKRFGALKESHSDAIFNSVEIMPMPGSKADGDIIMANMRHGYFKDKINKIDIKNSLLIENVIPTFSSIMIRKSVIENIDFTSPVPQWLDWWIWIQVSRTVTFSYVPEYLTIWRRHNLNYNRSYSLLEYLSTWKKMRNGIRSFLATHKLNLSKYDRLILCCPAIILLFIRMVIVWKHGSGIRSVYNRITSKMFA